VSDMFSVIPRLKKRPIPLPCDVPDEDTGTLCDLDAGHDGPHEGFICIQWQATDE